jgi:hypothetical protein
MLSNGTACAATEKPTAAEIVADNKNLFIFSLPELSPLSTAQHY